MQTTLTVVKPLIDNTKNELSNPETNVIGYKTMFKYDKKLYTKILHIRLTVNETIDTIIKDFLSIISDKYIITLEEGLNIKNIFIFSVTHPILPIRIINVLEFC